MQYFQKAGSSRISDMTLKMTKTITKTKTKAKRKTKTKTKVLKRLNKCYTFENQRVQGYKI